MKILLVGDASNYHNALAGALHRQGHHVTLASAGSGFMQTRRDIDTSRRLPGKLGGLDLYIRLKGSILHRMRGYDVVAMASPCFLELRPERLREVFRYLRRHNGGMFYTALSTDPCYIEECLDPASPLRYNEFRLGAEPGPMLKEHPSLPAEWTTGILRQWSDEFIDSVDGVVTALYEYHLALQRRVGPSRLAYGGIPIDCASLSPAQLPANPAPLRFFLGRHAHRMAEKGTDSFEVALRQALAKRPGQAEMILVENRPYNDYLSLLRQADVVLDQAYSYSPATNALLPMAMGIPAVSGGEPLFYDFISQPPSVTDSSLLPGGFDPLRPVINAPTDVDAMRECFLNIIDHRASLPALGRASATFVRRHNDADLVARRFLSFWQSKL